jgi:hypothetical protein
MTTSRYRRHFGLALVLAIASGDSVLACQPNEEAEETAQQSEALAAATTGGWGPVIDWPHIPIHATLLANGNLMTFGTRDLESLKLPGVFPMEKGGDLTYSVWNRSDPNPLTSHTLLPNATRTDIFCAAQVLLPGSGLAATFGGDVANDSAWPRNVGDRRMTLFDGKTMTGSPFDMAFPRWYPTAITLPNGEILIHGGTASTAFTPMSTPEIYNEQTGYRSIFGALGNLPAGTAPTQTNSYLAYDGGETRWYYPRSFVARDGRVFVISGQAKYYLNPLGDGSIQMLQNFEGDNRGVTSTAVMYAPGKVLQLGGSPPNGAVDPKAAGANLPPATRKVSIIDIDSGGTVTPAQSMAFGRHWANATVLPDGQVLVTGGSAVPNINDADDLGRYAELWSPKTGLWKRMSQEAFPRLYHSTALLLPDGKVLSAGGGEPGPQNLRNGQVFEPPYLFAPLPTSPNDKILAQLRVIRPRARRPTLAVADKEVAYGETVNAMYTGAVARVTLVKTGAVTHSFNSDQRFIEITNFAAANGSLRARLPVSENEATPGTYMMFVLNDAGVPSVAEMIHLAPKVGSGVYRFVARHSGHVLEAAGCSSANGTAIQQWAWLGGDCQRWGVTQQADGSYVITSQNGGRALDVAGCSVEPRARTQLWDRSGADCQSWHLKPTGNGYYRVISKRSGQALDVDACSVTPGAAVQQWPSNGAECQQWRIERVADHATPPQL